MEIIIEGRKIDTLDIWDIELVTNTREAKIIIKVTDKPQIIIGRNIPYETRQGEFREYWRPYEKLYAEITKKWEADKSDIPVFKLD